MPSRVVWLLVTLASMFSIAGCSTVSRESGTTAGTNQSARQIGPPRQSPEEMEKRGEAHARFLSGLSYDQNQEPEKALEEYEKALAGDPRNEALSVDLSRRYLQQKEFDKAIAVLKKAAQSPGASGLSFARL